MAQIAQSLASFEKEVVTNNPGHIRLVLFEDFFGPIEIIYSSFNAIAATGLHSGFDLVFERLLPHLSLVEMMGQHLVELFQSLRIDLLYSPAYLFVDLLSSLYYSAGHMT